MLHERIKTLMQNYTLERLHNALFKREDNGNNPKLQKIYIPLSCAIISIIKKFKEVQIYGTRKEIQRTETFRHGQSISGHRENAGCPQSQHRRT